MRLRPCADPSDIARVALRDPGSAISSLVSEHEEQHSRIGLAELASAFIKMGLFDFNPLWLLSCGAVLGMALG